MNASDSPSVRLQQALAALGEPHRFLLAGLVRHQNRSVGELVRATGLAQPLVSHHLSVLCRAGLMAAERSGRKRLYGLADASEPVLRTLIRLVRENTDLDADRFASLGSGASLGRAGPESRDGVRDSTTAARSFPADVEASVSAADSRSSGREIDDYLL